MTLRIAAALLLTLATPAAAQLQLARVSGIVVDANGQPMPSVTIELTDPLGSILATHSSDRSGRFSFAAVTMGRYSLWARPIGVEPLVHSLRVADALPIEVTLQFPLRTAVAVVVDEVIAADSPAARTSIAAETIEQVPIRNGAKGLQDLVATLPGWATEDNGLLHVRGIDDGFLYVIDGVPVYERLDQLSGVAPDASTIESMTVLTGFIPAEFGYKAGGVIDVRSKTLASNWIGTATFEAGSDDLQRGVAAVRGPASRTLMLSVNASGQRMHRFLDPVHPDNFHNRGDAAVVAGGLTWTPSDSNIVSARLGRGRSSFQVPNTAEQEDADQDQRQRIAAQYGNLTWQRAWSSSLLSQVSGYARGSRARLDGSDLDTPLTAAADRSLARWGAMASATRQFGSHSIKAGVDVQRLALDEFFQFAITDEAAAQDAGFSDRAVSFDPSDPFVFAGRSEPTLWSAFAQADWHVRSRVTVSGGVRFDQSRLLLLRRQISPRLGASFRVTDGTALRLSASRFFQPPQPENLLLSSSTEARQLSPFADESGGADLEPERQWSFEAGVDQQWGALLRFDGAIWYRSISDVADPNVFAGTTIIFPNAVRRGAATGADMRLEVARRFAWSGYGNFSIGRVRQHGPITGGLFLEDEIALLGSGEAFIPDHDQPVIVSAGVAWTPARSGVSVSLSLRHESGTPIERDEDAGDELAARPGAELVDVAKGRVKARTLASLQATLPIFRRGRRSLELQALVTNIFDRRYAYNFGNPFSGTHFGAPRTVSLAVRLGL